MSIATEIRRIQTAKTNIKNAIVAKGGTADGTIDTFAEQLTNYMYDDIKNSNCPYVDFTTRSNNNAIVTDILPKADMDIVAAFKISDNANESTDADWAQYTEVIGTRSTVDSVQYSYRIGKADNHIISFFGTTLSNTANNYYSTTSVNSQYQIVRINKSNLAIIHDSLSAIYNQNNSTASQYEITQPFYIGALNNDGTANFNYEGKIYYIKIYQNSKLTHDLEPLLYNGKIGFEDKVTGMFYFPSSTDNTLETNVTDDKINAMPDVNALIDRTITEITIPSSVTRIGQRAFGNCNHLTTCTIHDNVTYIGDQAFFNCTALTAIHIPEGITELPANTFYNCSSLTSITIPSTVTTISNACFSSCTSLATITFAGTVEQWNAITFGSNWHASVPATEVTCSDGTVTL